MNVVIAGAVARAHVSGRRRRVSEVLDVDPAGSVLAFWSMMKRSIEMPGRAMTDGRDPKLFDHFAVVAQRAGVYTAHDYVSIMDHLVGASRIGDRGGAAAAGVLQLDLRSLRVTRGNQGKNAGVRAT